MNPGLFTGTTKTAWHEFFPKLLVANADGTGLTQPINMGTPLRNLGRYTYLDPNTIFGEVHMSHSYYHPSLGGNEGTGAFYVIELPVKAKRWGGKGDETAPYIIGGGYGNKVLQTPTPEMAGVAQLADTSLFNIKGEADKYMQVYFPYKQQLLSGTWPASTQTRSFSHFMSYAPNAEDIDFHFTSSTAGQVSNPLIITSTTTSVFNIQFAFGNSYPTNIVGQSATGLTATAARYSGITNVVGAWGTSATGTGTYNIVPHACTIDSLYIKQDTAAGVGITRTYVIQKNGVDTTLTCTTSGSSQVTNSDTTHSVSFAAGDTIAIKTTADAVTADTGVIRWTVRAIATSNQNASLMGGSAGSVSASATNYIVAQGFGQNATASTMEQVMPTAGTIKNAYGILTGAPTAGKSYAFTLYKNGVATGLTFTIADTNTTGNDLTAGHAVTVAQGDRVYWECIPTGTPTARGVFLSAEFNPTTPGQSVHMYSSSSNLTNSAVRYLSPSAQATNAGSATESLRSAITQAATFSNLTVYVPTLPGAGKTWTLQDYKNGGAGSLSAQITNSSNSAQDNTNSTTYAVGDTMSFQNTPAGTPTGTTGEVSVVSYIQPTGLPTSDVTYEYKIKAEPRSDTLGSWAYSPTGPWVWSLVQGHYVQFIYEIDN